MVTDMYQSLSIGLVVSLVFIYRQMNQLHKRKKILANMNCELQHLNKSVGRYESYTRKSM